ncbi:O-acetylhomoserine aminocarboxypropyltransferase/cysteine synthase family protein [Chakrabartyella piscis]|uniref:O-acetylhomoserine aminocarboxypropyltransferase/cysteine synthase family protein n=1 Tax=Chakrabartyella piscis TaxID=2918914 RepID=UPI002958DD2B|nr:O-acetylhomoserine aminocarboxypropyltransferase/cysteine synthase family protein [Chakrabartyella piscis]
MDLKQAHYETQCVQGGYAPENGEPRVMPIVQSTTYKYDKTDDVCKLFDLEADGHMYSRISNPTLAVLEEKIALLEGGVGAMMTSSGQAANMLAILNICKAGQHVLAMSNLYGGTHNLFGPTFKNFGIDVTFVDPSLSLEELKGYIQENTRAVFGETIGNPGVDVLDFEKAATLAHDAGIPLIVDSTFATPVLCRPFEHGADIVTHSTTKYFDGHATSVGGVIVDSGKFDWNNGKFPELTQPDETYHGVIYTEKFGAAAYITKVRVTLLRDLGSTMAPFNAFLTNLGLETLALRMKKHSENSLALAEYLENHPKVSWVKYPLLKSSKTYDLAQKYLPEGGSGIIAFGVKGGASAGKTFIDSVDLASLVIHVGDLRTHVLHPATSTHRQLSEEQQITCGVSPDLIRLSVGIENFEDIKADLEQALANV